MKKSEIQEKIHKYFWFEKSSNAGHVDTIPEIPDPDTPKCYAKETGGFEEKVRCYEDGISELRLDWCNYELTQEAIVSWLSLYGSVDGKIEEEAMEIATSTGTKITHVESHSMFSSAVVSMFCFNFIIYSRLSRSFNVRTS